LERALHDAARWNYSVFLIYNCARPDRSLNPNQLIVGRCTRRLRGSGARAVTLRPQLEASHHGIGLVFVDKHIVNAQFLALQAAKPGERQNATSPPGASIRYRSRTRRLHAAGRGGEVDVCSRCCTTIPHPMLVAGSLVLHGRIVRRLLPVIERLAYFSKLPARLLRPPKAMDRDTTMSAR
jgi:hypothetical protein